MRDFLTTENLPPYYKTKANIVLSAADEANEPWENLKATKFYLGEAEKALKTAKETYVHHVKDSGRLLELEETIKEEWEGLRQREKETLSGDDDEEK